MPEPFLCTQNSLGNIDYGIPIVANKATDFRTSTGSYHRHVPNVAQEFDCRVKVRIKPALLVSDTTIRDEQRESMYINSFVLKFPQKTISDQYCAGPVHKIEYIRGVQERVFKTPPAPREVKLSEMKDAYYRKSVPYNSSEVFPPEPHAKCENKGLGRDEYPAVRPEQQGYFRLLDPYVSEYRGNHLPFTRDQQNGLARKDIVTCYDIANLPKAKGFGPRNGPTAERILSDKKRPMVDSRPFKLHPTDRRVRFPVKRVPNLGMTSECETSYVKQSFSVMYPYLFQNGEEFPESLSGASAWQNLAPPGMYCTDSCHIGTGWPVNSIIDYGLPEEHVVHKPCCTKFYDWSQ